MEDFVDCDGVGSDSHDGFSLVIHRKTLGELETNAKTIMENVRNNLKKYMDTVYDDSNIDMAKRDKAYLNSAAKSLNSERITIEREFMAPFAEFKDIVSETVKMISECSSRIDDAVKKYECRRQDKKNEEIVAVFNSICGDRFPNLFSSVFNKRWMNKSVKIEEIKSEISSKVSKVESDIAVLRSLENYSDIAVSIYLDCYDLSYTMGRVRGLNSAKEKAKEERLNSCVKVELPVGPPNVKVELPSVDKRCDSSLKSVVIEILCVNEESIKNILDFIRKENVQFLLKSYNGDFSIDLSSNLPF